MHNRGISIIIPNWNGRRLLEKNLPFLAKALSLYSGSAETIVVDDGSTDGSSEFLLGSCPDVRVLSLTENKGFAYACNEGVKASKNEIIYLMNSDIRVQDNFIEPLIGHFKDDDVFAVSSVATPASGPVSCDPTMPRVKFKYGIFWYYYITVWKTGEPPAAFFSSGGHSAFDKRKFVELGCFDDLYHPFYWEDADICYRAWKRGWKSLYEPESRVIHDHQSTIGANFKKEFIENINWRNRFLFTWKNLDTPSLWAQHLFFLPFELLFLPLVGRGYFTKGFFSALKMLNKVIEKRDTGGLKTLTDRQVLKILDGAGR